MILEKLCLPSILYIAFTLVQIVIDIFNNIYNKAIIKFFIMIIFAIVLNILCNSGLQVISWIIVLIPFIYLTFISSLIFTVFGNEKNISDLSNNLDLSNNIDISNTIVLCPENESPEHYFLRTQQHCNKPASEILKDIKRIDRDKKRIELYDKLDNLYNINTSNNKHKYDLSNNPIKYNLVKNFLDKSLNNYYVDFIYSKQLFKYIIPKEYIKSDTEINYDLSNNYDKLMKNYYIIDSNNYIPCPSNENSSTFFKKTGKNCYEFKK
tara:strand:+ start:14113 stop:14910 length:798 start_codon:yes stop_codon:yes gene_type:complete